MNGGALRTFRSSRLAVDGVFEAARRHPVIPLIFDSVPFVFLLFLVLELELGCKGIYAVSAEMDEWCSVQSSVVCLGEEESSRSHRRTARPFVVRPPCDECRPPNLFSRHSMALIERSATAKDKS